ncbi:hypothetical protein A6R68_00563 [Neotoma lepida]|uniref:CTCK domain-containing protein n=1 Tax=Neotoma lepida TaxID=56216 RepID=A0A1A6GY50_NEOLE|nr:hypothetical protein A6R68_00563 [Neotoma lepida]
MQEADGDREACSVHEEEQQITYQGCTANVTLTRCQGFCASSVSFNTDTLQWETRCGCCQPLSTYEKQLSLPCPDPNAPVHIYAIHRSVTVLGPFFFFSLAKMEDSRSGKGGISSRTVAY